MKKRVAIIAVLMILLGIGVYVYSSHSKQKTLDSIQLIFKDIKTIEYGDSMKTEDLIQSVSGDILRKSTLDTKIIGKQNVHIVVGKDKQSKTFDCEVVIQDTKKPVIELKNENIKLKYGANFNALDYIKSVSDPIDGKIDYHQDKKEGAYYTIENKVNTNKAGTYDVNVIAYDQNKNTSHKVIKVTVEEDEVRQEDPTKKPRTQTKPQQMQATTQTKPQENIYTGSKNRIIVIDPGHQAKGNSSKEAIGPGSSTKKAKVTTGATCKATGKTESQINLEVGLKLKKELQSRGYTVVMTRTSQNVNISNQQRAAIGNKYNAAAVIHLHCDSATSVSATGAHTICITKNNPYHSGLYSASSKLASHVISSYSLATGIKSRGVNYRNDLTGLNWSEVPAIYIEMGFVSNSKEGTNLSTSSFQNKCAKGIANGIDRYFK